MFFRQQIKTPAMQSYFLPQVTCTHKTQPLQPLQFQNPETHKVNSWGGRYF